MQVNLRALRCDEHCTRTRVVEREGTSTIQEAVLDYVLVSNGVCNALQSLTISDVLDESDHHSVRVVFYGTAPSSLSATEPSESYACFGWKFLGSIRDESKVRKSLENSDLIQKALDIVENAATSSDRQYCTEVAGWVVRAVHDVCRTAWRAGGGRVIQLRGPRKPRPSRPHVTKNRNRRGVQTTGAWYDDALRAARKSFHRLARENAPGWRRARSTYRRLCRGKRREIDMEERSQWGTIFARSPADAWFSLRRLLGKETPACSASAGAVAAHFGKRVGASSTRPADAALLNAARERNRELELDGSSFPKVNDMDCAVRMDEIRAQSRRVRISTGTGLDGTPARRPRRGA